MSDGNTRTGMGLGWDKDASTQTPKKLQVRMASGKIYGPYRIEDVLVFISTKKLTGDEEILFDGELTWRPISSEPVFFDALEQAASKFGHDKKARSKGSGSGTGSRAGGPDKRDLVLTELDAAESENASKREEFAVQIGGALAKKADTGRVPEKRGPQFSRQTAARDYRGQGALRDKKKLFTRVGFVLLLAGAGTFLLFDPSPNASRERISFTNIKTGIVYFSPLLEELAKFSLEPLEVADRIDGSGQATLPTGFGAHVWIAELRRLQALKPEEQRGQNYYLRHVWCRAWLASSLEPLDPKVSLQLRREVENDLVVLGARGFSADNAALVKAALSFGAGDFEATERNLKENPHPWAKWLIEESRWWGSFSAKQNLGLEAATESEDAFFDLSSRLRRALMQKDVALADAASTELALLDPFLPHPWFAGAQLSWRLSKDRVARAQSYFATGLATLSLMPASIQAIYWSEYQEFLTRYGRAATARKAEINFQSLRGRRGARAETWWDLGASDLDLESIGSAALASSRDGLLDPREMATLLLLGRVLPGGSSFLLAASQNDIFSGRFDRAKKNLEILVDRRPEVADFLASLMWAQSELFLFDRAFRSHEKLARVKSQLNLVDSFMGRLQSIGQEYDEAEALFARVVASEPQNAWAHFFRAQNYLAMEKYEPCFRSTGFAVIHATGELRFRSQILQHKCRVLGRLGLKDSLETLRKWVRSDSTSTSLVEEVADILSLAGLHDEAIKLLREWLERFPRSYGLWIKLGGVYERSGDGTQAALFFGRASRERPNLAEPFVRLGDLFLKEKDIAAAADNYDTATRLQPEYPEVWLKAARAYRALGNLKLAAQMYGREVAERPAVLSTFLEAADFLLESRAPAEVPKLFQSFAAEFRGDPAVMTRLAQAYLALDNLGEAQDAAATALAANPKIPEANRVLGMVFEKQSQYSTAKEYFEKYLILAPIAPDASEIRSRIARPPYSP